MNYKLSNEYYERGGTNNINTLLFFCLMSRHMIAAVSAVFTLVPSACLLVKLFDSLCMCVYI